MMSKIISTIMVTMGVYLMEKQGTMVLTKLHEPEQAHPKELEPDPPDKQVLAIQFKKQTE